MQTRKRLLLSGAVIAIVALLATTAVLADPPTQCTTTDFVVDVDVQEANGFTTYTYTMSNNGTSSENPNKFAVLTKGRQSDDQGLVGDLEGFVDGSPAGTYVYNSDTVTKNCPPAEVWQFNKTDDAFCFPSVAIGKIISLKVSERYKPEEGTTGIFLGYKNTFQYCAPILGPTTPSGLVVEGSPLSGDIITTVHIEKNNCFYDLVSKSPTDIVYEVRVNPASANNPLCRTEEDPDSCTERAGLIFCPPLRAGDHPMEVPGSDWCYAPQNWWFWCGY